MDFLAAYSSDDSSLDSDHVRRISEDSINEPSFEAEDKTPRAESNSDIIDRLVELDTQGFADIPLVSYLQEYSMNAKRQMTAFPYLPWQPSREAKQKLRAASNLALRALREKVPNFDQRFASNSMVSAKSVAHGVFGHTNKRSLTDLHVSLFPNIFLPPQKLKPFCDRIQRAVRTLEIPPELVTTGKVSALDMMISDEKATGKKLVQFRMDNKLHLHKLTKSGSLFVGVGLRKFGGEKRTQLLPQFEYLALISKTIEDEAKLSDFGYNWLQFSVNKRQQNEIMSMYYHFTLVVCELHPRGQRVTEADFQKVKEWVDNVDASKLLRDMTFEADHLVIKTLDVTKKIALM